MSNQDDYPNVPLAWTSQRTIKRMRRMGLVPPTVRGHIDQIASNFVEGEAAAQGSTRSTQQDPSVVRQLFDKLAVGKTKLNHDDSTMVKSLIEGSTLPNTVTNSTHGMNTGERKSSKEEICDGRKDKSCGRNQEMPMPEGNANGRTEAQPTVVDIITPKVERNTLENTIAIALQDDAVLGHESQILSTEDGDKNQNLSEARKMFQGATDFSLKFNENRKLPVLNSPNVRSSKKLKKGSGEEGNAVESNYQPQRNVSDNLMASPSGKSLGDIVAEILTECSPDMFPCALDSGGRTVAESPQRPRTLDELLDRQHKAMVKLLNFFRAQNKTLYGIEDSSVVELEGSTSESLLYSCPCYRCNVKNLGKLPK